MPAVKRLSVVFDLLFTSASAILAQFCNPIIRLSPVTAYGMQNRHDWGDLPIIVGAVFASKLLLKRLLGLTAFSVEMVLWRRLLWRLPVTTVAISVAAIVLFLVTAIPCSPNFLTLLCLFEVVLSAGMERATSKVWQRPVSTEAGRPGRSAPLVGMMILAAGISTVLGGLVESYHRYPTVKRRVNMVQNQFRAKGSYGFEPIHAKLRFRQLVDFDFDERSDDLFVLERAGRLYRVGPDKEKKELLVDFRADVGPPPTGELGACSVKLHPRFTKHSDERLYLFYTSRTERGDANKLVEVDLSARDPWARRRVILNLPTSATSHNSGALDFDDRGFLFVALGDVQRKEDSQVLDGALNGKILRIDPAKTGGAVSFEPKLEAGDGVTRDYFIPADNPFVSEHHVHGEIWAYGIRNPFRVHWEPGLHALSVGDVGQLKWEELNLVRAGDNCGWPGFEGREIYDRTVARRLRHQPLREPIYAYRHDALNRAVVGGFLYKGTAFPDLIGSLVAADNFSGNVWAIRANGPGTQELLAKAPDFNQSGIGRIAEGPDGEIWVAVMGAIGHDTGAIYRLKESNPFGKPERPEADHPPGEKFAIHCALCHGLSGDGRSAMAREFAIAMPDFSSPAWQAGVADDHLKKVIADGGGAVGMSASMPAWRNLFSEIEIDAMTRFIRSLGQ